MNAIPSDSEALKSRGFWLGFSYLKATGDDVQSLFKMFALPELQKSARNHLRVEMATYYLSKWSKIVEPVLREQFSHLPSEAVSAIKQQLQDGALSALTMLTDATERDDLLATYRLYAGGQTRTFFWSRLFARDAGASFWSRLHRLGFSIDIARFESELGRFEKVTIDGTVLCCMLDSLTLSQEEAERDHKSLLAAFHQQTK